MFVILQKYDFSSKSQHLIPHDHVEIDVCDTAKVRFFKQITTGRIEYGTYKKMFVILQKYDFSSKSQQYLYMNFLHQRCLWYCKSTIFQANHNKWRYRVIFNIDVCDTAKVRFFKQITTATLLHFVQDMMFVILQKYDFSSKSQQRQDITHICIDVCDTAKVRFFKQITTDTLGMSCRRWMFVILQKYDFSSKSQLLCSMIVLV